MKHLLLLLSFTISTASICLAQVQVGNDIDGEAIYDVSGYSVSMPDATTISIGARGNDGNGNFSGHTRVYKWNGVNWVQKGSDIDGEAAGDEAGACVSMPDTNTLAVGALLNDGNGNGAGHVRIFKWSGSSWVQRGSDIDGENGGDVSGASLSMPDSNTVAIGATGNDGNGTSSGHVRVYRWNGTNWVQKGADIDGEAAQDRSGVAVSMPNSNTVAIGAKRNSGNGSDAGHVRIFRWNGSAWVQKGGDIDGEAAGDESGGSVHMADANHVAIGATLNYGGFVKTGHVRVYRWNGTAWVKKGADIDGEFVRDESGYSVFMPDTNFVAIGALDNDGNGTKSGHVRLFRWNGTSWQKKGSDIDGESSLDNFGFSISMPDTNTIAASSIKNDDKATDAGHVRIYSFCPTAYNRDTVSACNSYRWSVTNQTYTTSGVYADTLVNRFGCDSILSLKLTINKASGSADTVTVCDSYYWTQDSSTYNSSGVYKDTIVNAAGCDSIITLHLTVNYSASSSDTVRACDSYTWPLNAMVYNTSGTYKDTVTTAAGCDSAVTLVLTVVRSTSSIETISSCNRYTWAANSMTYTKSGTYKDTLSNSVGCDSLVTLNLTVYQSTSNTETVRACDRYTWLANGSTYNASGTYRDTILNGNGCDSLVTLNLTINSSSGSSFSATACDQYTWPLNANTYTNSGNYTTTLTNSVGCDSTVTLMLTINKSAANTETVNTCREYTWAANGRTYNSSGRYSETFQTVQGCDSIETLDLTIVPLDTTVSVDGIRLTTNETEVNFQWLTCPDLSSIAGATAPSYTATANGSYAVEIEKSGCKDTSGCYEVIGVGQKEIEQLGVFVVYPNPSTDKLTVVWNQKFTTPQPYRIQNINGEVLMRGRLQETTILDVSDLPSGAYFVVIAEGSVRFVKE